MGLHSNRNLRDTEFTGEGLRGQKGNPGAAEPIVGLRAIAAVVALIALSFAISNGIGH